MSAVLWGCTAGAMCGSGLSSMCGINPGYGLFVAGLLMLAARLTA